MNKNIPMWLVFRLALAILAAWLGSTTALWLLAVWTAGDVGVLVGKASIARDLVKANDIATDLLAFLSSERTGR